MAEGDGREDGLDPPAEIGGDDGEQPPKRRDSGDKPPARASSNKGFLDRLIQPGAKVVYGLIVIIVGVVMGFIGFSASLMSTVMGAGTALVLKDPDARQNGSAGGLARLTYRGMKTIYGCALLVVGIVMAFVAFPTTVVGAVMITGVGLIVKDAVGDGAGGGS